MSSSEEEMEINVNNECYDGLNKLSSEPEKPKATRMRSPEPKKSRRIVIERQSHGSEMRDSRENTQHSVSEATNSRNDVTRSRHQSAPSASRYDNSSEFQNVSNSSSSSTSASNIRPWQFVDEKSKRQLELKPWWTNQQRIQNCVHRGEGWKWEYLNYMPDDLIGNINFEKEEHWIVMDCDWPQDQQHRLGKVNIICMPNATLDELADKVIELINKHDNNKKRYITAMIFERATHHQGYNMIESVIDKISAYIKDERAEWLNKRKPPAQEMPMVFKVNLTYTTLPYSPSLEHHWDDIAEANQLLKNETMSLHANPFNYQKWLSRFDRNDKRLMECKTTMFIESTILRSGLGLKLSTKGFQKVTDGLIRHHSEGVREVRSICLNEALPKPLDQTQGYRMVDANNDNNWIHIFMQQMAAIKANMKAQQQQQRNHEENLRQQEREERSRINQQRETEMQRIRQEKIEEEQRAEQQRRNEQLRKEEDLRRDLLIKEEERKRQAEQIRKDAQIAKDTEEEMKRQLEMTRKRNHILQLNDADKIQKTVANDLRDRLKKMKESDDKIEVLNATITELKCKISKYQDNINHVSQNYVSKNEELTEYKTNMESKVAEYEKQFELDTSTNQNLRQRILSQKKEIDQLKQDLKVEKELTSALKRKELQVSLKKKQPQ